MMQKIYYPTERHKEYIEFLDKKCLEMDIGYAIKGSLATGLAREFSDIDILVFPGDGKDNIDPLLDFEIPLMMNKTENPKDILMVHYKNGLCVELDCRDYANTLELNDSVIMNNTHIFISDTQIIRKNIVSKYNFENAVHKQLRLFYKSLLKYLCGKKADAYSLLDEYISVLNNKTIPTNKDNYLDRISWLLQSENILSVGSDLQMELTFLVGKCHAFNI